MFDTRIGRFLSQDPLSFDAGDENLYRYVGNNPVSYADPSGCKMPLCDAPIEQLLKRIAAAERRLNRAESRYNFSRTTFAREELNKARDALRRLKDCLPIDVPVTPDPPPAPVAPKPVSTPALPVCTEPQHAPPTNESRKKADCKPCGNSELIEVRSIGDTCYIDVFRLPNIQEGAGNLFNNIINTVAGCPPEKNAGKALIATIEYDPTEDGAEEIACALAEKVKNLAVLQWSGEVAYFAASQYGTAVSVFTATDELVQISAFAGAAAKGELNKELIITGVVALFVVGAVALRNRKRKGSSAPKTFFGKSAGDLSKAGRVLDPADKSGQFTKAGRSLTKHQAGARAGSTKFPTAKGNPATVNQQAQCVLDDILNNPGTTFNQGHRPRFGNTIEAISPDGRGVVFDANGNFLFFAEF